MPSYELRVLIPGQVWMIGTSFRMFGVIPINNNALLIKAPKTDGSNTLVAVNAPELTPQMRSDVHGIEADSGAKVEFILETDWHHLFAKDWAAEFPGSTVLFAGHRGLRQQSKEAFSKAVLDQENPRLPNVDESFMTLIPWVGFKNRRAEFPNEERRGEVTVYLSQHKLLFTFDILVPLLPWRCFLGLQPPAKMSLPMSNFGTGKGFPVDDPKQCSDSAKRLLELPVDTLVCAHGHLDCGAIRRGDEVKEAMAALKVLLVPQ